VCNSKICVRVTPPERSVKRKKEKGRCLILFGQKSERSEKRKTQEKEKKEEKKPKKKEKKQKGWSKLRPPRWKKDAFRLSNFTSS